MDRFPQACRKELPYSDLLDALLTEEIASKCEKTLILRTRQAHFPFDRTPNFHVTPHRRWGSP
jgi:hypothetical protein